MALLRERMDDQVDEVIEHAQELRDWKTYVRRYPWTCVAAAAAAGYLVVPRRSPRGDNGPPLSAAARRSARSRTTPRLAFGSLSGPVRSMVVTAVQRAALSFAAQKLGATLSAVFGRDAGGELPD